MQVTETGQKFIGTRCHVCTGCGRCVATYSDRAVFTPEDGTSKKILQVVTDRRLQREPVPIRSAGNARLVTADIGTTTIAMQLYAVDGTVESEYVKVNPQTEYGADVLSRIEAAKDTQTAGRMRKMVQDVLEEGTASFQKCLKAGEYIRMVLAGNTTMIYLLCGHDPTELGSAPFYAAHLEGGQCKIGDISCHVFPGLSAFVGGDITAGMYACGMAEREEVILLIDLGTNGEMVLGNKARRIACATAAGPAFEGGVNRGIWGADMVHLLSVLRKRGIMDETGLLADTYFDEGVRIGDVCVTQNAIRAIQLAKAAIRSGIDILMQEYGIAGKWEKIAQVVLAGGFGYYLDPEDAADIGLLPAELAEKTVAGGNTALAGALRYGRELLQAGDLWGSPFLEMIAGTEILNLAAHPDFEEQYIRYLDFPQMQEEEI